MIANPSWAPRPPRVEDRDDVVRAVAMTPRAVLPWCGSPEKPSARISSLRRLDAESGPFRGSLDTAREFNTGPRVAGEQEVAVEVDVVEEVAICAPAAIPSPDSTMQPSIRPSPSARAVCAMRTASRIPPTSTA